MEDSGLSFGWPAFHCLLPVDGAHSFRDRFGLMEIGRYGVAEGGEGRESEDSAGAEDGCDFDCTADGHYE